MPVPVGPTPALPDQPSPAARETATLAVSFAQHAQDTVAAA